MCEGPLVHPPLMMVFAMFSFNIIYINRLSKCNNLVNPLLRKDKVNLPTKTPKNLAEYP